MFGERLIPSALVGWFLAAIFYLVFTIGETYLGFPTNTGILMATGAFTSSVGIGLHADMMERKAKKKEQTE